MIETKQIKQNILAGNYINHMDKPEIENFKTACPCGCSNCHEVVFDRAGYKAYKLEYETETTRLIAQYRKDVFEALNMTYNRKRDIIFNTIYERYTCNKEIISNTTLICVFNKMLDIHAMIVL